MKNFILSVLLIIIISFVVWSSYILYHPKQKPRSDNHLPDAFIEDVEAYIMDKAGKLHLIIKSPHLTHYAEENTTDLITPKITLYRDSPKPWLISSKLAKALKGVDTIYLWDHVVIHHLPDEKNPETFILTNKLTVQTEDQLADTDELITLKQPALTLQAIGMHADIKSGRIQLFSNVKGEYVPTK